MLDEKTIDNMKRYICMNLDLRRSLRSYSSSAVMSLLGIDCDGLRKLEGEGTLIFRSDLAIPGYSAEQVDKLMAQKAKVQ